jgi:uncharacterized DUF497 family protein
LQKHKVSFEIAATILRDPKAVSIFDTEHSDYEDRWVSIGIASNNQFILMIHAYNEINAENIEIRIISARKATKNEIKIYRDEL